VRQYEVHEAGKAERQATLQANVDFQHARLQKFLVSPVWTRVGRSVSGDGKEAESRIRDFEERNILAKKDLKGAVLETSAAKGQLAKVKGVAEQELELYDTREERRFEAQEAAREAKKTADRVAKVKELELKAVKVNLDGQPIWKTPRTLRGTSVSWEDATTLAGRNIYCHEYSESRHAGDDEKMSKHNASLAARKAYRGEVGVSMHGPPFRYDLRLQPVSPVSCVVP